ncbi:MAG: HEAT repeat domain-containing protein [Gemmatimonadota bacterium]
MKDLQDQSSVNLKSGAGDVSIDDVDRETARRIEEFVTALLKDYRTRQAYVSGNQLIERFHGAVLNDLIELWESLPHLTLTIDEGQLFWRSQPVYDQPIGHDNFAFMFFREGIRTLAFLPGCEQGELREFVEILANVRRGSFSDLLATLWHRDFSFIRIEYVDVGEDEGMEVPAGDRNAGAGDTIADMSEISRVVEAGPVSTEVDDAFHEILLSDADQAYLVREVELDEERDLVHDVTLALLDQFEMRDHERRQQVVDILRRFLPDLLAIPDFKTVALIVNELQLLANKTGERDTQELVVALLRDMSEAMAALVSTAAEAFGQDPEVDEVDALLGALQAEALPTLVRALPSVSDPSLRGRIEQAIDSLVARFPEHLIELLIADDPVLAAESALILARIGVVSAVSDLIRLANRPETVARRAAIEALAFMPADEAGPIVLGALDDPDWTVRKTALQAIIRLAPVGAARDLRQRISSRRFAGRDEVEQAAFLMALVAVGPEESVPELAQLLNGRGRWGGKQAAIVRAGAARALASVGTPAAVQELEKAKSDRNSTVTNAVQLCLRHLEQTHGVLPDEDAE